MVIYVAIINVGAIVDVLAIDELADEDIIVLGANVSFPKIPVIATYSIGVPPDVPIIFFVEVLTDVIMPEIDIELLIDVNANFFAVATTSLKFAISTSRDELNR